jgi:hypothetical protein
VGVVLVVELWWVEEVVLVWVSVLQVALVLELEQGLGRAL